MEWRKVYALNSTANDYSSLKWPLTFASILTTLLAIVLLLSFQSDAWFTYEVLHVKNDSITSNTTRYTRLLESGSVGLWTICVGHYDDPSGKCDLWTKETRPHSFNTIIILVTCALFFANLTVFPSWGSSILILYNMNNRYIHKIAAFIGILVFLTFTFTAILIITILFVSLTPFYTPGKFSTDTQHLYFHAGQGLLYASFASFLSIVCLLLIVMILIWKKIIEARLRQMEKDLLKQLSNDGFQPGWHKLVIAPRTPTIDESNSQPPPYDY